MLICFSYCHRDQDLALKNAQWIAELGGCKGHTCLVVRDQRANPAATEALRPSFDSLQEIVFTYDTYSHWPESANRQFQFAATHIEWVLKSPYWLFMEADAIFTHPGAADALQADYESARKPFMGDRVAVDGVPVHMSGNGIYPGRMTQLAGEALVALEVAWDVQASHRIVPNMHDTKLIEHSWEGKERRTFESVEQVKREIAPETVLFHSSKDGSLIDILRKQKGGDVKCAATAVEPRLQTSITTGVISSKSREPMRQSDRSVNVQPGNGATDIFIKTYAPDYEWLEYSLRSIAKFATGFRGVVIVSPENVPLLLPKITFQIRNEIVGEQPDGYLWQQVIKLDADKYTDADYVLYLDSDTILTKPVTPCDFFDGGLLWMMTPWAQTSTPWQPIIEKFLKRPVAFEFMRRAPQMVPRWLLSDLRAFCEREHGTPLASYVMNQPYRQFSEFNAMGAFAYEFHRDKFAWTDTSVVPPEEWPELVVDQQWSRGGITKEIRDKWESILKDDTEAYMTLKERFDSKWTPEVNSGCWLWTAAEFESGYGLMAIGGRSGKHEKAHRVAWQLHKGEIPEGMHVLHRCVTPSCVNPDHLFLGTHADNMADMVKKGRHNPARGENHWRNKRKRILEGGTNKEAPEKIDTSKSPEIASVPPSNHFQDHVDALKREFTSPLKKARIIRALKFAPIIKP